MKQTEKYSKASQILTFPHSIQNELYEELNRLGWRWNAKNKRWERDESITQESKLIELRVWTSAKSVEQAAELFVENAEAMGLRLIKRSPILPCRPPKQHEARIVLTFEDVGK